MDLILGVEVEMIKTGACSPKFWLMSAFFPNKATNKKSDII